VITLALDASTYAGSVCIVAGREVVAAREVQMRDSRSERLMPAVVAVLAEARGDDPDELAARIDANATAAFAL
jgi:tRNA A37 threonylcarbamoyladenosine modification protein TsaB